MVEQIVVDTAGLFGFAKITRLNLDSISSVPTLIKTIGTLGPKRYDVSMAKVKTGVVITAKERLRRQDPSQGKDKIRAVIDATHPKTNIMSPNPLDRLALIPHALLNIFGAPFIGVPNVNVEITQQIVYKQPPGV